MLTIPDGFRLVPDDYILKRGDLFSFYPETAAYWEEVYGLAGTRVGDEREASKTFIALTKINKPEPVSFVSLNEILDKPKIPDGYELVKDINYVIKKEDLYHYTTWGNKHRFLELQGNWQTPTGKTYEYMKANYDTLISKFSYARKLEVKPRFKSPKPYPFGY